MKTKARLHQLIEALSEPDAERVLRQLEPSVQNGAALASERDEEEPTDMVAWTAFFDDIVANAPEEDVNSVPPDLSENLDHYVYSTRKRNPMV